LGIHKPSNARDKRPTSKRGMTVDKNQQPANALPDDSSKVSSKNKFLTSQSAQK